MELYNLKEKIQVNKEFLEALTAKGWQEVEYLQNQIVNIDKENIEVIQLLNNLLTSYYIFIGGVENLIDKPIQPVIKPQEEKEDTPHEIIINKASNIESEPFNNDVIFEGEVDRQEKLEFEPFVYERPNPNRYEILDYGDGEFEVVGGFIDELVRGVVLSDSQSFAYFQKVLKEKGIIKELKKRGADENSTIRIKDIEFEIKE